MSERREPKKSRLRKSDKLAIRKNIEISINGIIDEWGLIAQQFIENEVEGWEQVPIRLTNVYYRRRDDESLLLFDFHPIDKQHQ